MADHQFDRRISDVNLESLAMQFHGLVQRVEALEGQGRDASRALSDLKPLAQDVHDAMFGTDGKDGVKQVVEDIRDLVQMGRGVFRFAQRVSNGVGRMVDFLSRTIKRFWPIAALAIAVYTYLRTGRWEWPGIVP